MKRGKKHAIRIICLLLAICVMGGLGIRYLPLQTTEAAVFDETTAMRFSLYSSANEIEDGTLFIGTYLVHVQALTDEIYELAQTSASDSNQTNVYYKSELSSGYWYDITEASGLEQISGDAVPVESSDLADLWVTHVAGSDGVLREVVSSSAVSPFDIPNPYDLYNLPELQPLRIQYDNTLSEDSTGVDKYYYDHIKTFFELDLQNTVTQECDRQIESLQAVCNQLQADDKTDLAQIVSTLMDKIDSRRRAEIFYQLSQPDDCELNYLQEVFSGSEYREEDYDDKQFVENSNITEALGTCMENCEASYTEHSGNMLDKGTTVLKNAEYDRSMDVIDAAEYGDSVEDLLQQLQHVYHIQDDVVANAKEELKLLDDDLIPKAEKKYSNALKEGAGSAYKAAVSNRMSQAAKDLLLEERKTELEAIYAELQYLLDAKAKRMPVEEAIDALLTEMDKLEGFKDDVKKDDFQTQANATIDAAESSLMDSLTSIAESSEGYSSEMDKLEQQKADLQEQKQQALDDNDLGKAKELDAQIALVDEQIAAKEAELNAILENENSSAAEKAQATLQSGANTLLNNINKLKNKALEAVAEGNTDSGTFENMVEALTALGAESALEEIKDKVSESSGAGGSGSGDSKSSASKKAKQLIKDLENAVKESKNSSLHDANDGSDVEPLDETALNSLIESQLGDSFENLPAGDKAAVTAAFDRLGEQGNTAAATMSRNFLNQCLAENSIYIYLKLSGNADEYLPVSTIAKAEDYRYVYNQSRQKATLTKQGTVYNFTVGSDQVTLTDESVKTLAAYVEIQQDTPYLAESDATDYFSCEAEYVENTNYGVCLTKKLQEKAEELVSAVQEGAQ